MGTSESYPEMNNILMICKVFHCNINDLVNDGIVDIDSLDEEIKMSVVKFKEEKQKKIKGLSKAIMVISKISKVVCTVGIVGMIILSIAVPFLVSNIEVEDEKIMIYGNELVIDNNNGDPNTTKNAIQIINNHSNGYLIFICEFAVVSLAGTLVIGYLLMNLLDKLFNNIYNGETPFTLDNVSMIKKLALFLILIETVPTITGYIGQFILGVDMNIEVNMMNILYILIIFAIAFIFEYGYEIQLDSKGKIYGEYDE